jgi:prepilin peptidase CpaA
VTAFDTGALVVAAGAALTDVKSARIPNALTVLGAITGLIAHGVLPGGAGALSSLAGTGAGLAVFFPIFALGGLGGGDVKLMAAIGAWMGWPAILSVALYTALAGGVLAVGVALARGYLGEALDNLRGLVRFWMIAGVRTEPSLTLAHGRGPRLPYALPIFAGLVVTIWRH